MKRRGFLKFIALVPVALAVPPPKECSKELTKKHKERIIGEMLRTSKGRKKLAEAMAQPLRIILDYESVSRKILTVKAI